MLSKQDQKSVAATPSPSYTFDEFYFDLHKLAADHELKETIPRTGEKYSVVPNEAIDPILYCLESVFFGDQIANLPPYIRLSGVFLYNNDKNSNFAVFPFIIEENTQSKRIRRGLNKEEKQDIKAKEEQEEKEITLKIINILNKNIPTGEAKIYSGSRTSYQMQKESCTIERYGDINIATMIEHYKFLCNDELKKMIKSYHYNRRIFTEEELEYEDFLRFITIQINLTAFKQTILSKLTKFTEQIFHLIRLSTNPYCLTVNRKQQRKDLSITEEVIAFIKENQRPDAHDNTRPKDRKIIVCDPLKSSEDDKVDDYLTLAVYDIMQNDYKKMTLLSAQTALPHELTQIIYGYFNLNKVTYEKNVLEKIIDHPCNFDFFIKKGSFLVYLLFNNSTDPQVIESIRLYFSYFCEFSMHSKTQEIKQGGCPTTCPAIEGVMASPNKLISHIGNFFKEQAEKKKNEEIVTEQAQTKKNKKITISCPNIKLLNGHL